MSDLSDEGIRAYFANIQDLEDAREATQRDLKEAWAHIREAHGKKFADSLKLAVKRKRMDSDKLAEADEVDAEADRILALVNRPSQARGARVREDGTEYDAETGEFTNSTSNSSSPSADGVSAPFTHRGVGASFAGTEGETDRPHFISAFTIGHVEPVTAAPPAVTEAGDRSAASPSAAPVADHSKPNPICRDPDDCGTYASWHSPCLACQRAAAARAA